MSWTLGEEIRLTRERLGMSLRDFGRLTGLELKPSELLGRAGM